MSQQGQAQPWIERLPMALKGSADSTPFVVALRLMQPQAGLTPMSRFHDDQP